MKLQRLRLLLIIILIVCRMFEFYHPPYTPTWWLKNWRLCIHMYLNVAGYRWNEIGLGLLFKDNCLSLKQLFKEQVILMDKMETIRCPSDAKRYFANCMQSGTEVYARIVKNLKEILSKKDPFPFWRLWSENGNQKRFWCDNPCLGTSPTWLFGEMECGRE